MKTILSKEQSKNLCRLGCKFPNHIAIQDDNADFYLRIELTDLLEILPKEIDGEPLFISFGGKLYDNNWFAYYGDAENGAMSLELIDAIYELVCRCINNNKFKIHFD